MTARARQLIDTLGLLPHPEGGWYREIFRSAADVVPGDGRASRSALTAIYFLLRAGEQSRWHCVQSDETWTHLEGVPVALWTWDAALRTAPAAVRLGPVDAAGTRPLHVVTAGQWQAARPSAPHAAGDGSDGYTLVACTVAPGFDFGDFSLMPPDGGEAAQVRQRWPELATLI